MGTFAAACKPRQHLMTRVRKRFMMLIPSMRVITAKDFLDTSRKLHVLKSDKARDDTAFCGWRAKQMREVELLGVGCERSERAGTQLHHDSRIPVPVGKNSLEELCLEGVR